MTEIKTRLFNQAQAKELQKNNRARSLPFGDNLVPDPINPGGLVGRWGKIDPNFAPDSMWGYMNRMVETPRPKRTTSETMGFM